MFKSTNQVYLSSCVRLEVDALNVRDYEARPRVVECQRRRGWRSNIQAINVYATILVFQVAIFVQDLHK